jgi:hypothetical protein
MRIEERYLNPILQALSEHGGSASAEQVIKRVSEICQIPRPALLQKYKDGRNRFEAHVRNSQQYLRVSGYVNAHGGIWTMSQEAKSIIPLSRNEIVNVIKRGNKYWYGSTARRYD